MVLHPEDRGFKSSYRRSSSPIDNPRLATISFLKIMNMTDLVIKEINRYNKIIVEISQHTKRFFLMDPGDVSVIGIHVSTITLLRNIHHPVQMFTLTSILSCMETAYKQKNQQMKFGCKLHNTEMTLALKKLSPIPFISRNRHFLRHFL